MDLNKTNQNISTIYSLDKHKLQYDITVMKHNLIQYIENDTKNKKYKFFSNIFLILKIQYLEHIKNTNNSYIYIPDILLRIFKNNSSNITLFNLVGCYNDGNINDLLMENNKIFISENYLHKYFKCTSTKCTEENKIENVLDLYISIITYIYYIKYIQKLNNKFSTEIETYIKTKIYKTSDSKVLLSVYSSTIYDLTIIPNTVKEYLNEEIGSTICYQKIKEHYLKSIHDFYDKYILSFLLHRNADFYENHPLLEKNIAKKIYCTFEVCGK